jgi:hypothetical protein
MTITSSTGGRIIHIPGGLIHYMNTDRLVTEPDNTGNGNGRVGRPTKVSVEEGLKFDFSAFLTSVKPTSAKGRVVTFK